MNKKIIAIVVALLLLLVVGAGAIMMMKKPVSTDTGIPLPTAAQTNSGSLKDLLTGGKAQKCTFSSNTEGATGTTTIYVAKGKIRGDIVSNMGERTINSHMLVDSSYSYVWTDDTNQGYKFSIAQQTQVTPSQNNGSIDLNQKVNYTCENWNEDSSLFQLPANITFQTMTVPSLGPTGADTGSSNQCAVCDQLPAGEAQEACKTQLGCK